MPATRSKAPSKPSKTPAKPAKPLRAIRQFALEMNAGNREWVRLGTPGDCPPPLRPYRFGRNPTEAERAEYGPESKHGVILPVLPAIHRACLDCSGYVKAEVRNCTHTDCQLHPFRNGTNPSRSGAGGVPTHGRGSNGNP